jgi:ribosomal protein S18 acetylase RimI-like enzyme
MNMTVEMVDYADQRQAADLVNLLDSYARDPMGGGEPLADEVKQQLVPALAERSDAFSLICYVQDEPAGLINCFEGFSTFKAKPLLNIHDVAVDPKFRGRGVSQALLAEVETIARERGYCKITLEVLAGNQIAQRAYLRFGFADYELNPAHGKALFWQKTLQG